jgi:hypothetical protein
MSFTTVNTIKRASLKLRLLAASVIILLFPFRHLCAQTSDSGKAVIISDTNKIVTATDTNKIKLKKHSPKKAMLMSACLPGLGQAYNKKYWKIPVIYASAAAIAYFAIKNLDSLNVYTSAYKNKANGNYAALDSFHNHYQLEDLLSLKTQYKRLTDITFILGGVLYALNIIDATVDAYMFTYDIGNDLSMKISPTLFTFRKYSFPGLSFSFTFGKHLKQTAR